MTIQRDLARREPRGVLDGLADELRRREEASAGRMRTQVHRAFALYAIADVSLPALVEILRQAESAANTPDEWTEYATGASAVADQAKGFARGITLRTAAMRDESPKSDSAAAYPSEEG